MHLNLIVLEKQASIIGCKILFDRQLGLQHIDQII